MLTSSHCKLDLDMRFKLPLLASDEEFERAAALFDFLANAALRMVPPPLTSLSSPFAAIPTVLPLLDSLAVLLALFTLGMAPVGRMEADELHTLLSVLNCCSSAVAAIAMAAVTGPVEAERAARSMETFGVSGEV